MSNGQTNGIPQGSQLMNFIAEIVLTYSDEQLSERIRKFEFDYKILRYRDDYRIFVNNLEDGKKIIKELTEVLSSLGMRLSKDKTIFSEDVIDSSIKPDKLFWIMNYTFNKDLTKHLLIISQLSKKYPNSGTLLRVLQDFYARIEKIKKINNLDVLISIIIEIAFRNPRIYPVASAILGKFISLLKTDKEKMEFIQKIEKKFLKIPNTEFLNLWLQRITLKIDEKKYYKGKLSESLINRDTSIWNFNWLKDGMKEFVLETNIIDDNYIKNMESVINYKEVSIFEKKSGFSS